MNPRLALALLGLLLASAAGADLPAPDLALLRADRNLLSNGSFEAGGGDLPEVWTLAAGVTAPLTTACHGQRALLVDVPAGAAGPLLVTQTIPVDARCTYELSGWLKALEDRGGQARLELVALDDQQRPLASNPSAPLAAGAEWTRLAVAWRPPPGTCWLEVRAPVVTGAARVAVDAVSLIITAGPRHRVDGPPLTGLRAKGLGANWVLLEWDSRPGWFQVEYRVTPVLRRRWETTEPVDDTHYTLLNLKADAPYEFRVRLAPDRYFDENGKPAPTPLRPGVSAVLADHTPKVQARSWGGLRLWPTVPLGTFPSGQNYPNIESYDKKLYVVETYGGGLHLSRVNPDTLAVEWTRQILARPAEPDTLQGLVDTCLHKDQLYFTYNVSQPRPGQSGLQASRQMVATYDLVAERLVGEPRELQPRSPGVGTWSGSLAVFRDQVWVAWLETWQDGAERRTQVLVAPFVTQGELLAREWQDAPGKFLTGLALSVFEDQLLILCSDAGASRQRPGYEPLLAVRCDGEKFHDLQKLSDLGYNRRPRGVQLVDRFYLMHRNDAAYPTYSGLYADIMLTILGPQGLTMERTPYVADMTCNTWPDVTVLGQTMYVVYHKYNRSDGDVRHVVHDYGTWIGRIDLSPVE